MNSILRRHHKLAVDSSSFLDFYQHHLSANGAIPMFVSNFFSPYQNFALEQFIFNNNNGIYSKNMSILVYRNSPSIVFGAFQNPWFECNVVSAVNNGINVCRRKSGGGTVFHDLGNLNFSIFSSNKQLHRTNIMKDMASFLESFFNRNINTNHRNDIVVDGEFKISGSAAKFEKNKAYHHHTLLCHSDLSLLEKLLDSNLLKASTCFDSNATKSVRSSVTNLFGTFQEFENSLNTIISGFSQHLSILHNRPVLIIEIDMVETEQLTHQANEFRRFNFVYGNTPPFSFTVKVDLQKYYFKIMNGLINEVAVSNEHSSSGFPILSSIHSKNKGNKCLPFTMEGLNSLFQHSKYSSLLEVMNKITF